MWLVTGTPFSTSLDQLSNQSWVLGHAVHGLKLGEVWEHGKMVDNDEVVDTLKKILIRHTKSQRIGGQAALSLPDTDQAIVFLDMNEDEKLIYQLHRCSDLPASGKWVPYKHGRRLVRATLSPELLAEQVPLRAGRGRRVRGQDDARARVESV